MEPMRLLTKEERIARTCHEVNRAYCAGLGDYSHLPWESTPDFIRNSVISGVCMHLQAGPDDVTPGTSHELWMNYKTDEGWKYGPVKNLETKKHPNLVPFHRLPLQEQIKDHLFGMVVRAMRDIT